MPLAVTLRRWCPLAPAAGAALCAAAALLPVADTRPAQGAEAVVPAAGEVTPEDVRLVEHRTTAPGGKSPEQILEEATRVVEKGTSSSAARKSAAAALPVQRMTAANRARAEAAVASASLFRELPAIEIEVEPAVYDYFVSHPDVAASIWRVMKISKFDMWQTGSDSYEADAGDGAVGLIDALYRGPEQNVVYCEGTFTSPLLTRPIKATALLHLRTQFGRNTLGRTVARSRLSMFVTFPSQTVETAAKLVSPVSNVIVDRNFREVCLFVRMMQLAMERQPGWVEQVAARMDGVLEPRRKELVDLTAEIYVAARKRELAEATQDEARR